MPLSFRLSKQEQLLAAGVARDAVRACFKEQPDPTDPPVPELFPENLRRRRGAFVTLFHEAIPLGCMGVVFTEGPLIHAIWESAVRVVEAVRREPVVQPLFWFGASHELDVEVEALSEPTLCRDPDRIVVGRHGLALRRKGKIQACFPPNVPRLLELSREECLERLGEQAGLEPGDWEQDPEFQLYWFRAHRFSVDMLDRGGEEPPQL